MSDSLSSTTGIPSSAVSFLATLFSAALLILSFPRFDFEFLAWFAFVPLFTALDGKSGIKALKLGFLTGFLFFLGLIYWVTHSMTNYGGVPIFLGIFILSLLAAFLAIYFALFTWLLSLFRENAHCNKWIVAPFLWISLEWVRTHFLTGFPWGTLGYSQFKNLSLIQISDITGVYGVSFLIMMINVSIYLAVNSIFFKKGQKKFTISYSLMTLVFLSACFGYGLLSIEGHVNKPGRFLKTALIQGNIKQGVKWDPAYKDFTLTTYIDLTKKTMPEKPDLIVWPEAALPLFIQERGKEQERVLNFTRESGINIFTGSPAYEQVNGKIESFNRAYLIRPDNKLNEYYDKIHLVPYGEYIPLKQLFPFIEKMTEGIGDFSTGSEYKVFNISKGKFSSLICYEVIFPDLVRKFVDNGADFLVNITNDAWFGKSAAPYQHFAMITFRAVENKVPVIRAANTGISGIIDSIGKIVLESDIFEKRSLVGDIRLVKQEKTIYTRYGDLFAYMCLIVSFWFIGVRG